MSRPPATPDGAGPEAPSLEEHVSQHLLCPISHCIMDQPVVAPSGHTYDRAAILAWLARRPVDPISGAPLSPLALYPNRALQDEIAGQLEGLADRARARGDTPLAKAARAKLGDLQAATRHGLAAGAQVGRLDRWVGHCACWATWWGEFCREQALVFTTSLGALLCFVLDASAASKLGRATGGREGRPPPQLLSAFIRLAVSPTLPPPKHWRALGRLSLASLRCMLLLPAVPACVALSLGSALSLARFAQRFLEVRAVELEQAAENRWWLRARDVGSAITGITSFGLFVRLYLDSRAEGALRQ